MTKKTKKTARETPNARKKDAELSDKELDGVAGGALISTESSAVEQQPDPPTVEPGPPTLQINPGPPDVSNLGGRRGLR